MNKLCLSSYLILRYVPVVFSAAVKMHKAYANILSTMHTTVSKIRFHKHSDKTKNMYMYGFRTCAMHNKGTAIT
jgi:hypothetical protein